MKNLFVGAVTYPGFTKYTCHGVLGLYWIGVRSMVNEPSAAVCAQMYAPGIPRYTSAPWMGAFVTESASFPVIVPVMAAAGVAGSASVSSRQRTTRLDVAARRKSVELIRIPPQGSAANAAGVGLSDAGTLNYTVRMRVSRTLHLTN